MRIYFDESRGTVCPNGSVRYGSLTHNTLAAVGNCLCRDGVRRMVYATSRARRTDGTIAARVSISGKSIAGFLEYSHGGIGSSRRAGYFFYHYSHARNARLIDTRGECDMELALRFAWRHTLPRKITPAEFMTREFPTDYNA